MARTIGRGRSRTGFPFPTAGRAGKTVRTLLVYAVLLLLCLFVLLPIGWMLTAALKPDTAAVFTYPPEWFPSQYWNWDTFHEALFDPQTPYLLYARNSMVLVLLNVIGSVISCSLIAYPFARLQFRGKNVLFSLLIGTMLLPGPVLLIPQFLMFNALGWVDTYLPLVVPAFTGNAYFIFLLRQYMRTIPRELDEAARIDGASYWTIFFRIILPLTGPALTVVGVFQALWTWNDFFGPLIYLNNPDKFTVALGLATMVHTVGTKWNEVMAANLVAIIPALALYFVAQKRLIGGIASVGLKG